MKKIKRESISKQVKDKVSADKQVKEPFEYDGDIDKVVSTGSTLLDLAISGGRIRGGGIPAGILVEIFGPSGTGKTVMLSEIAGDVQRQGGDIMFHDPEARLNRKFAQIFGLNLDEADYSTPDTVPQVFEAVRKWEPNDPDMINGVFADSLAALSTDMEMDKDEGDKMGMRRAKELSQELRMTARVIANDNILMVCSNQVRVNVDGGQFAPKYKSPGGEAVGFYSSLRLRTAFAAKNSKIYEVHKIAGKDVKRVVGVTIDVEVFKSSIWKPYRKAPVTIIFDYGIDDVLQNLQFLKTYTKSTVYTDGENKLDNSMAGSIAIVEDNELQDKVRESVINLWEEIESKFKSDRKPKKR